jgi:PPOX class probable FMN-dependent enzyme
MMKANSVLKESLCIDDKDSLESHFDTPIGLVEAVIFESLDKYHRMFIERSPFLCIATSNENGQPTISPKGDAPGFIKIIDNKTLIIPDRIGNNKVESFHNIIENPKVGLIFMVPGIIETLRISGAARIITDHEKLKFAQVSKNPVNTGLVISINQCYFHCGKAVVRSKLWKKEHKIERKDFPSFGKILNEQAKLNETVEASDIRLNEMYKNEIY